MALTVSVTVNFASCGGGETSSVHQHTYTEEVVQPNCTTGGYTLHRCDCGDEYRDNETPATGHSWGELVVDTPATWDEEGVGHRVCLECEAIGSDESISRDSSAWHEICAEGNEACFVYDDDGALTGMKTADSEANMFLNMFAIGDEVTSGAYSVEVTFDPTQSDKNEKGSERTYGIVAWYKDKDNYLIYWLQQKAGGDWSGQLYGKVNGNIRSYVLSSSVDSWNNNEWNDMWWDGNTANPQIKGVKHALLNTAITLKVVSTVTEVTIGEEAVTVRAFELIQIVNGEEHVASTYYIKDAVDLTGVRTGVYVNNYDIMLKDFCLA